MFCSSQPFLNYSTLPNSRRLSSQRGACRCFLIPLPGPGAGREGGKWGNLGVLDERAHGEKSQFGEAAVEPQSPESTLSLPPRDPSQQLEARRREATGRSNESRLRGDALSDKRVTIMYKWKGTKEEAMRMSRITGD